MIPLLGLAEEPAAKKALKALTTHDNDEVRRAAKKARSALSLPKSGHSP